MNPTTTLCELLDVLREQDRERVFDGLESLLDWLAKGGMFPDVVAAIEALTTVHPRTDAPCERG